MLPSLGQRLLGISSPGLVPSMDYSISLRALDHTELYLDSQKESSNPPATCRSPCHPPRGQALWSCEMSQQARSRFKGVAGESPALWQWEALVQNPKIPKSLSSHPTDQVQGLPAPGQIPDAKAPSQPCSLQTLCCCSPPAVGCAWLFLHSLQNKNIGSYVR